VEFGTGQGLLIAFFVIVAADPVDDGNIIASSFCHHLIVALLVCPVAASFCHSHSSKECFHLKKIACYVYKNEFATLSPVALAMTITNTAGQSYILLQK